MAKASFVATNVIACLTDNHGLRVVRNVPGAGLVGLGTVPLGALRGTVLCGEVVGLRSGVAAGHTGYFHEAAFYDGDEQLLAIAVPFLVDGVAAGEPVVVGLGERHAEMIRAELHRAAPALAGGVTYLAGDTTYARPATAIKTYRAMLADYVAGGADQIRIIGELDPAAFGPTWDWWARYESAVNHAYDEFPLWSMCAYNTVTTPRPVLDDIARTHPWVATPDGRHPASAGYIDPPTFLTGPRPAAMDPLQRSQPAGVLIDPVPFDVRQLIRAHAPAQFDASRIDDFLTGATEAIANAIRHGYPPVEVRLWAADDRLVLTVTDRGAGVSDPFAGLLPRDDGTPGGFGLWLAYQLCDYVTFRNDNDGFTIRLTAGAAALSS